MKLYMSDKSTKRINIDLDFLDTRSDEALQRKKRYQHLNEAEEPKKSKTLTRNTIIIGIVGFIILALIFGGQSDSSSPSSNNQTVKVGDYNCPSSAATAADALAPKKDEKGYLDSEQTRLDMVSSQLTVEKNRLDTEYVNQYSQFSIDQHNEAVDAYNAKLQKYKSDLASDSTRVDTYNATIKSYNTYLVNNCTKN